MYQEEIEENITQIVAIDFRVAFGFIELNTCNHVLG